MTELAAATASSSAARSRETSAGRPEFNLRLPAIAGLALAFEPPVRVVPERHLRDGDEQKVSPGQACGCYIDDASAERLLRDAAALGNGNDGAAALLRLYGW